MYFAQIAYSCATVPIIEVWAMQLLGHVLPGFAWYIPGVTELRLNWDSLHKFIPALVRIEWINSW